MDLTYILFLMVSFNYKNLKWAMDKNEHFLKTNFFREYGDNDEYLQYLDKMVLSLRQKQCKNIQEKFRMGGRISDFNSGFSELLIGHYFTENGYEVNFIPETYSDTSLPDFYAYKNERGIFVEVKRIIEDDYLQNIINYLTKNVNLGFPVHIDLHLNQNLSKLSYTMGDKNKKRKIVTSIINQFESHLLQENFSDNMNISTDNGWFTLRKMNWSFDFNLVTVGGIKLPSETNKMLIDKIKKDVIKKAKSKLRILNFHEDKALVIALVFEDQFPITPDVEICLEMALLGLMSDGLFFNEGMECTTGVLGYFKDNYRFFSNPNADVKMEVL
jgi:hypothetical protein